MSICFWNVEDSKVNKLNILKNNKLLYGYRVYSVFKWSSNPFKISL